MLKEEFEAFHRDNLDTPDKTIYRIKAEGDGYRVSWGNEGDSIFYLKHEVERFIKEGKWIVIPLIVDALRDAYEKLENNFITLEKNYESVLEENQKLKQQVAIKDDTTIYFTEKINYNTNYKVYYKNPTATYEDKRFKGFIGKVDNFVPTGLCAFMNSKGEMLHVHYRDIIQMHVTKENK